LIRVAVHPANWQDKVSLPVVLRRVPLFARWELLVLDGGYDSPALVHWCEQLFGVRVEIVRRNADQSGFQVLPKRWVVECTFAWLGKCRRLSKDYEYLSKTSEQWIYLAMTHLMLKRLSRH
jgi:putative transposase